MIRNTSEITDIVAPNQILATWWMLQSCVDYPAGGTSGHPAHFESSFRCSSAGAKELWPVWPWVMGISWWEAEDPGALTENTRPGRGVIETRPQNDTTSEKSQDVLSIRPALLFGVFHPQWCKVGRFKAGNYNKCSGPGPSPVECGLPFKAKRSSDVGLMGSIEGLRLS